jgi:hypothetical protein
VVEDGLLTAGDAAERRIARVDLVDDQQGAGGQWMVLVGAAGDDDAFAGAGLAMHGWAFQKRAVRDGGVMRLLTLYGGAGRVLQAWSG